MAKSPGKWIKTLLFGKKATKSHSSKGRDASMFKQISWALGFEESHDSVVSSVLFGPDEMSIFTSVLMEREDYSEDCSGDRIEDYYDLIAK